MSYELRAKLIDTHCHLDFPEFNQDREAVISRAKSAGLEYIINIGSSLEGVRASLELAGKYDLIYAAVGIHPHDADSFNHGVEAEIRELAGKDKVVAIGEIGLDYYRNLSKPENQKKLFISLLGLAKDLDLPIVIHCRLAEEDVLAILKQSLPVRAVVHCFSGNENFLQSCLDLGLYVSFTCNITFRKSQGLRELVKLAPLERIFLETDAPFLSPEGLRGKRNEPANVKILAEEIAAIKQIDREEVARVTTQNAKRFFKLP